MKSTKTTRGLKSFTAAITLLGLFVAIPISRADDDKETKIKIKNGDNGDDAKIKIKNGEDSKLKIKGDRVKVKGKAARDLLKPEVTSAWVDGYTVPNEYHTQFTEIPVVKEDNVVLRYYNGRAYYVNSDNWTIVRVTEIDPSFEASSDSSVWVEGVA